MRAKLAEIVDAEFRAWLWVLFVICHVWAVSLAIFAGSPRHLVVMVGGFAVLIVIMSARVHRRRKAYRAYNGITADAVWVEPGVSQTARPGTSPATRWLAAHTLPLRIWEMGILAAFIGSFVQGDLLFWH